MTTTDLYMKLFGKGSLKDGNVIDMAEHGRVGGLSTGEPYKKVGILEVPPTDPTKLNSSLVITYDASNNPITLEKTINGVTYTKTLTWVGGVCVAVSAWS